MNFIVWRALRDGLPTDARVVKMGITIKTTCCCRISTFESTDHLFCRGNYALDVWKVICGTFGIPSKDILLRQLLINWWRQNTSNPVYSIIVKYLPALTIWEIWKSRCETKYGSQKINVNKSISQIAVNISQLVNHFLGSNKMKASWEEVLKIISSNVYF